MSNGYRSNSYYGSGNTGSKTSGGPNGGPNDEQPKEDSPKPLPFNVGLGNFLASDSFFAIDAPCALYYVEIYLERDFGEGGVTEIKQGNSTQLSTRVSPFILEDPVQFFFSRINLYKRIIVPLGIATETVEVEAYEKARLMRLSGFDSPVSSILCSDGARISIRAHMNILYKKAVIATRGLVQRNAFHVLSLDNMQSGGQLSGEIEYSRLSGNINSRLITSTSHPSIYQYPNPLSHDVMAAFRIPCIGVRLIVGPSRAWPGMLDAYSYMVSDDILQFDLLLYNVVLADPCIVTSGTVPTSLEAKFLGLGINFEWSYVALGHTIGSRAGGLPLNITTKKVKEFTPDSLPGRAPRFRSVAGISFDGNRFPVKSHNGNYPNAVMATHSGNNLVILMGLVGHRLSSLL